ncbi:hypothetical protein H6A17_05305 [Mordavella massiliensis]|nr:hypothetical protein [Mordavella massiliensis]
MIRKSIGAILVLIVFAIILLSVVEAVGIKEAMTIFIMAIITTVVLEVGILFLVS